MVEPVSFCSVNKSKTAHETRAQKNEPRGGCHSMSRSPRCTSVLDLHIKESDLYSFNLFGLLSSWVEAFNFILLLTKLWKTFDVPKCWKPLVCKARDCKLQQVLLRMASLSLLPNAVTASVQKQKGSWHPISNGIPAEDAVNLSPGLSSNPSCQSFKMTEENQYLWTAWPYIITASCDLQHSK